MVKLNKNNKIKKLIDTSQRMFKTVARVVINRLQGQVPVNRIPWRFEWRLFYVSIDVELNPVHYLFVSVFER